MEFQYILKFSADLHWKLQNNPMLIMAQMNQTIHISQFAQWSKLDMVQFAHKVQQRHRWQSKECWYFLSLNRKGHEREEENVERNYSKYNVLLGVLSWLKKMCNKIFNFKGLNTDVSMHLLHSITVFPRHPLFYKKFEVF